MEINTKNMCTNEIRKAGLLITKAAELRMNLDGYGIIDVNQGSGFVYLWLEDYQFSLYVGFGSDKVMACYSDPMNGEEFFTEATTLAELEDWAKSLENETEEA
jgi:hypothetical protein